MTIKTIQEGFALMGAKLSVNREENTVTIVFGDVKVIIDLCASEKDLKGALFFLNLNIVNLYNLVSDALAEG